jgi:hypothetical protein
MIDTSNSLANPSFKRAALKHAHYSNVERPLLRRATGRIGSIVRGHRFEKRSFK